MTPIRPLCLSTSILLFFQIRLDASKYRAAFQEPSKARRGAGGPA